MDVLRVGKQVEQSSHCERETRPYQKRNSCYWESMKKYSWLKRLCVSGPIEETATAKADHMESLTSREIKQKLKDVAITTKL